MVKSLLKQGTNDTKDDALLGVIISGVSATVSRLIERNRFIENTERTEVLNVQSDQKVFRVKSYPINRLISVVNDGITLDPSTVTYDDKGFLRIGAFFSVTTPGSYQSMHAGSILQSQPLRYGPGMLHVRLEGGMADDEDDFEELYPDLAYEVAKQVVFEFRRMATISERSVSSGSETTTHEKMEMLKSLQTAIQAVHVGVPLG
jgi:hypothetical protein